MAQWIRFKRDFAWTVPGNLDGHPVILYKAGKRLFAKGEVAEEALAKGYAEAVESKHKLAKEKAVVRRTGRRVKADAGTGN